MYNDYYKIGEIPKYVVHILYYFENNNLKIIFIG